MEAADVLNTPAGNVSNDRDPANQKEIDGEAHNHVQQQSLGQQQPQQQQQQQQQPQFQSLGPPVRSFFTVRLGNVMRRVFNADCRSCVLHDSLRAHISTGLREAFSTKSALIQMCLAKLLEREPHHGSAHSSSEEVPHSSGSSHLPHAGSTPVASLASPTLSKDSGSVSTDLDRVEVERRIAWRNHLVELAAALERESQLYSCIDGVDLLDSAGQPLGLRAKGNTLASTFISPLSVLHVQLYTNASPSSSPSPAPAALSSASASLSSHGGSSQSGALPGGPKSAPTASALAPSSASSHTSFSPQSNVSSGASSTLTPHAPTAILSSGVAASHIGAGTAATSSTHVASQANHVSVGTDATASSSGATSSLSLSVELVPLPFDAPVLETPLEVLLLSVTSAIMPESGNTTSSTTATTTTTSSTSTTNVSTYSAATNNNNTSGANNSSTHAGMGTSSNNLSPSGSMNGSTGSSGAATNSATANLGVSGGGSSMFAGSSGVGDAADGTGDDTSGVPSTRASKK